MKKVALVTSGYMPVPASLGGAVECLDDYLIKQNEIEHKCNIEVFSCYEPNAEKDSFTLKNTKVRFIKTPEIIKLGDLAIYYVVKFLKPHAQTMSYRYILQRLYFIAKVAKVLHLENYDEVMLENHATLLLVMKKYKNYEKYKGRFIYHLHNEQKTLYGCEEVLKNVKTVATVSNYISSCIKKGAPVLRDNQIQVWRNCVDSERFGSTENTMKSKQLREEYGIKDDEIVALYTGRLSPEKGIKELLLAFKDCNMEKLRLVIAGGYFSGDKKIKNVYEDELRQLTEKIGKRIIFTGFVDYHEIPDLYMMSDFVVIPSIWNDPAPLTVIETITSGKPLITTKSGGIPEYANEKCAILLERDSALIENLRNAIILLSVDDKKRLEMSENSIKVSKEWGLPQFYKGFIDILNQKVELHDPEVD